MLLQCQKFLRQKKVASLQQIARGLGCQESAVEPMLQHLVRRGRCRSVSAAQKAYPSATGLSSPSPSSIEGADLASSGPASAQSSSCGPCGGGCGLSAKVGLGAKIGLPRVFYQWVSATQPVLDPS